MLRPGERTAKDGRAGIADYYRTRQGCRNADSSLKLVLLHPGLEIGLPQRSTEVITLPQ